MSTPKQDQETAVTWFRDDDEVQLSTSDSTMKTRLRRRGYQPYEVSGDYANYRLPLDRVRFLKRRGYEREPGPPPTNFDGLRRAKRRAS